ncbi:MAG: CapA family protein [Clostridiales bacterium]|nr:CapA family protein [Clostridiales bacterium]
MKKVIIISCIALVLLFTVILFGGEVIVPEESTIETPTAEPNVIEEEVYQNLYEFETEDYSAFDESVIEDKVFVHKVNVLSVGDIMAHSIQFEAARTEEGYDFYPQFEYIADKISSKDIAIANLETVFAGEDARYSGKNMIFNAPDQLGESIKKAGFDVLTTANNHSLDRGFKGIKRTLDVLDDLEIEHTGTFRTKEESEEILVFEEDGISFALLSYSYSTNGWPIPENEPFSINMMIHEKMIEDIKKAKALDVDFVMVAIHWGLEYHLDENYHQRDLANKLFYEGADIILGTHPHVIQPFEHKIMTDISGDEKDKFIVYSQGNFLSGQRKYPRAIGMYINFEFQRNGSEKPFVNEVSVMPTYVEDTYKNSKRFMRILDMNQAIEDFKNETLDINQTLYNNLLIYEETFVNHLSSKMDKIPTLNAKREYTIYTKEGKHEEIKQ